MSVHRDQEVRDRQAVLIRRLRASTDPAILDYLTKLRARYAKYALPAADVRSLVDQAMGTRTLTEVLDRMRDDGS